LSTDGGQGILGVSKLRLDRGDLFIFVDNLRFHLGRISCDSSGLCELAFEILVSGAQLSHFGFFRLDGVVQCCDLSLLRIDRLGELRRLPLGLF
jgi:hypothetical protein